MLKVSNGRCIRRIGFRSMKASKTRNIVAVIAIALTTILFTSLFTIAASINYSYQQENFRRAGGDGHGTIKEITWEQAEELRDDGLIKDSWARLFVGMPSDPPFNKSHVEVSYIEPNGASHYFCTPVEGTLPHEGTDEMATDTNVLSLLGIEPEIGAKVTLSFYIDEGTTEPKLVERTFTLSGWWYYDSAVVANNVLIPRSAAEEISAMSSGDSVSITGKWSLDLMFKSSLNIRENINTVLNNHGYQNDDIGADNYLKIGVNWGYTGERFSSDMDIETVIAVAAILLLIVFTGYLIIYNVFQISVTNDIRFYGLLKTIGTTGRQIKRIIRQEALLLSLMGIPLGLIIGFFIGNMLTPIIMNQLSYKNVFVSFNPWIFIGAAAFSLITVFISCARPGRMAARVSPVEAVRFTEGGSIKKAKRKNVSGASLPKMAWANLGRSRSKTVVTVVSLTLAVVLMSVTFTFAAGFDMDKYLEGNVVTDFIVGQADQFVAGSGGFSSYDSGVSESVIEAIDAQGGITDSGRIYAISWSVQQFVPEDWLRQEFLSIYSGDMLEQEIAGHERLDDGRISADALLYGMEDFPLSQINVVEGDLEPLSDPANNAIAAVCETDDHGRIREGTATAKVGDTVTMRYVDEWGYYDIATGEELSYDELDARFAIGDYNSFAHIAKTYTEREYTVCAVVSVPYAISFRYGAIGGSSFVMGAEQFKRDVELSDELIMLYVFNTTEEANAGMESFLSGYTETDQPLYDYESKQSYAEEFEGFRNMFVTMGGALSFIIGLVGVLNFINAVLTGILTRKREFAVLQSIGMTGNQLKTMLVYEGMYYTVLALVLSLAMSLALGVLAGDALTNMFFFFTYRFTVTPIMAVLPMFLLLGALVPLAVYSSVSRCTVVERLREADT